MMVGRLLLFSKVISNWVYILPNFFPIEANGSCFNSFRFTRTLSFAINKRETLSIQLCTSRDVVVDHEQVQVFFTVFLVDGADDHAAAVDAHHGAWWQIGDGDQGFTDEFFRFIVFVNAG